MVGLVNVYKNNIKQMNGWIEKQFKKMDGWWLVDRKKMDGWIDKTI